MKVKVDNLEFLWFGKCVPPTKITQQVFVQKTKKPGKICWLVGFDVCSLDPFLYELAGCLILIG